MKTASIQNRRSSTTVSVISNSTTADQVETFIETASVQDSETHSRKLKRDLEAEDARAAHFWEIFRHVIDKWWMLFIGVIFTLMRSAIWPIYAYYFTQIFKNFATKTGQALIDASKLEMWAFIGMGILQLFTLFGNALTFGFVAEALTYRLRYQTFKSLMRQDAAYYDEERHSTGKLCTRLATDAPSIRASLDLRLALVLEGFATIGIGTSLAFYYGWQMTLMIVACYPLLALAQFYRIRYQRIQSQHSTIAEQTGKLANEAIVNIRTVQALTQEQNIYNRFTQCLRQPYYLSIRSSFATAASVGYSQSVMFFIFAISFRFGAYVVQLKKMVPDDILHVFFSVGFSSLMMGFSSGYIPEVLKARLAAGLIFKTMATVPRIDNFSRQGMCIQKYSVRGDIRFDQVSFQYANRPNVPVLDCLNMHVPAGETLALVGISGCGKSTIVNLLQRLYDTVDGTIMLDGLRIESYNVRSLRSAMAIVSQEPVLFDRSIEENITYGMQPVPKHDDVVLACKAANIHNFIISLPMSYDTRAGDRGTQLSGGQKQRIAIARALIRSPNVLLLDEATSALDTQSELVVQEALETARQGRTCIIVAHRLSTIKSANRIVVIDNGRVIESGTHQELINYGGSYSKLIQKQKILAR